MKKTSSLVILLIVGCVITLPKSQVLAQEKNNIYTELSEFMEKFEKKCPDIAAGFYNLHDSVMNSGGQLSIKEKEFIALGIAVSTRCEYCIYYHTMAAMKTGATEEEILEAASVAIYMSGGPGYVYIKHVMDALEVYSSMKESKNVDK